MIRHRLRPCLSQLFVNLFILLNKYRRPMFERGAKQFFAIIGIAEFLRFSLSQFEIRHTSVFNPFQKQLSAIIVNIHWYVSAVWYKSVNYHLKERNRFV